MPNNRVSAALSAIVLALTAHTLSAQSQYSQVAASQKQIGPLGQSITLVLMDFTLTLNAGETGSMALPSIVLNPNQTARVHVAGYLKYPDASVSQVSSVAMGFSCPGVSSPNSEVTLTQTGQFTIQTSQPIDDETVFSNTTSQATTVSCTLLVRHQSATGSAPILFGVSPGTAAVRFSVTILAN